MYTKYSGEVTARILEEIAEEVHASWVLPAIEEGQIDRTAVEIEQELRSLANISRRKGILRRSRAAGGKSLKTKALPRIISRSAGGAA